MNNASDLETALSEYLKHWGPIKWQTELRSARPPKNPELGKLVLALSAIETDSRVIYERLHAAGGDRDKCIFDFYVCWRAEEAEHGRALRHIAALLGAAEPLPVRRIRWHELRSVFSFPLALASRAASAVLVATYMTHGTIQEYIALATYQEVASRVGDPAVQRVLMEIAAQEGRHLRFYRTAAQAFLDDPIAAQATRWLLERLWWPPGVDLLGLEAWRATFSPILADRRYRTRLVHVDQLVGRLPGLASLQPMSTFFAAESLATAGEPRRC